MYYNWSSTIKIPAPVQVIIEFVYLIFINMEVYKGIRNYAIFFSTIMPFSLFMLLKNHIRILKIKFKLDLNILYNNNFMFLYKNAFMYVLFFSMPINWLISLDKMSKKCQMKTYLMYYITFEGEVYLLMYCKLICIRNVGHLFNYLYLIFSTIIVHFLLNIIICFVYSYIV